MDSNLKKILEEFEEHKGQFVITDFKHNVQRLIAIGEDDLDYYYVYWDGRKTSWESCVGKFVPLKGYIRDEDYNEFIRLAKLNHYDRPEWGKDAKGDEEMKSINDSVKMQVLQEGNSGNNKYLTDICWDLI